jgi:hypothetical protein
MRGFVADLVDKVLKLAYDNSNDAQRADVHLMQVEIRRAWDDLGEQLGYGESRTYAALLRIFKDIPDAPHGCEWIDFEAFLEKLLAPLLRRPLVRRLLAALYVLGHEHSEIAKFLDKAIAAIPVIGDNSPPIAQIAAHMGTFRAHIKSKLGRYVKYEDFNARLIGTEDHGALECKAINDLWYLATRNAVGRYSRDKTTPGETHRWLREKLGPELERLRNELELEDMHKP